MVLPSGRPTVTDQNPGPGLALLAVCSAGGSALIAGSALAYQLRHRHLSRDSKLDINWHILLTAGLLACIAQSIVTFAQVGRGLGYQVDLLTAQDASAFVKLEYANNLLYIGALLLLKGVQFLLQFATTFPRPNYYVPGVAMFGMFAFFFAAAFECNSPFWMLRSGRCFNQWAFWIAFGIFDIITDVYSISVVMRVSSNLQLKSSSKAKLMVLLGSKFLPVGCAIARLPFVKSAYTSSNYTIELYRLGLPTQLQLHLAVVALSLGKIFRFLNFLDEGWMTSTIAPTHGKGTVNRSKMAASRGSYHFNSNMSNGNHAKKPSISDHDSSKHLVVNDLVPEDYGKTYTDIQAMPMKNMGAMNGHTNQRQDVNGIFVTKTYDIRSEEATGKREADVV